MPEPAPVPPEKISAEPAARDQPPCHAGFVFAFAQEAGGLVDRLAGQIVIRGARFSVSEGGLAGRRVAVVVSGAGGEAARRAAEALIAGHRPAWLVSAGFAGGLTDQVRRGDLVIANEVVGSEGPPVAVAWPAPPPWSGFSERVHAGRLVTVAAVAATPEAKRDLAARHGAIAVDMESLAVAETCRREQVRFLSIRIISDAVDETLPPEVANLVKQPTVAGKLGALAGAVFKRPSSVKDLYRLKQDALVASDRLADFLAKIVPRL